MGRRFDVLATAALALVAGCYRAAGELPCTLTCVAANDGSDCPNGLACNDDGMCSVAGAACGLDAGSDTDGMVDPDGPPPDDPPGQFCIGTPPIRPCFEAKPTGAIVLNLGFNTDTDCESPQDLDGRAVCVHAADMVTILGTPRFTGSKPLVLVGVFSIEIPAGDELDLGSQRQAPVKFGAGTQPQDCPNSETPSNNQDGAGGGSFGSRGGQGGKGAGSQGAGGTGAAPAMQFRLRGGCRGADGPNNNQGGPGGGAVYLISNAITIAGAIRATGGGGAAGDSSGGGAGGGTGGYIGIDAANVAISGQARLVASGGGGGGGGCMGIGGIDGSDANTSDHITAPGGGGADGGNDGDGGAGSSQKNVDGRDGNEALGSSCAGGGGGGGVGTIQFFQGKTCNNRCFPLEDVH